MSSKGIHSLSNSYLLHIPTPSPSLTMTTSPFHSHLQTFRESPLHLLQPFHLLKIDHREIISQTYQSIHKNILKVSFLKKERKRRVQRTSRSPRRPPKKKWKRKTKWAVMSKLHLAVLIQERNQVLEFIDIGNDRYLLVKKTFLISL